MSDKVDDVWTPICVLIRTEEDFPQFEGPDTLSADGGAVDLDEAERAANKYLHTGLCFATKDLLKSYMIRFGSLWGFHAVVAGNRIACASSNVNNKSKRKYVSKASPSKQRAPFDVVKVGCPFVVKWNKRKGEDFVRITAVSPRHNDMCCPSVGRLHQQRRRAGHYARTVREKAPALMQRIADKTDDMTPHDLREELKPFYPTNVTAMDIANIRSKAKQLGKRKAAEIAFPKDQTGPSSPPSRPTGIQQRLERIEMALGVDVSSNEMMPHERIAKNEVRCGVTPADGSSFLIRVAALERCVGVNDGEDENVE